MKNIINGVRLLKNDSVRLLIDKRIKEFKEIAEKEVEDIFKECCFCILTANFDAEKGIRIQTEINNGFITLTERKLALRLKQLGHRFPNTRAKHIIDSRKLMKKITDVIKSDMPEKEKREWLVKNVSGLGYKEASHFLRNTGHMDVSILDFHILDILEKEGIIKRPKTITRKRYLEIENILKEIAEKSGLQPGELDLYLWYMETGKVLK